MLGLAVKAGLPLIAVETDDLMNAKEVIREVVYGDLEDYMHVHDWATVKHSKNIKKEAVYVVLTPDVDEDWTELYDVLLTKQSVLVLVNCDDIPDHVFNAGVLPIPKVLVRRYLLEAFDDEDLVESIVPAIGGLSLRYITEVARLTMARDGSLTAVGVMRTRMEAFPTVRGLDPVLSEYDSYWPNEEIQELVEKDRTFFLSDIDARLVPRGVLLTGSPGVGKTAFSKFVSNEWGVPLFRFDVGAVKGKYVGQSEASMRRMIQQVEREAPCVVLIDEVEKLFKGQDDGSETTGQLLSYLLWWMSERTSRIYVVMTSNNYEMLPPELYRPGRVDMVLEVPPLDFDEAIEFSYKVIETFKDLVVAERPKIKHREAMAKKALEAWWREYSLDDNDTIVHAEVINLIKEVVKSLILKRLE